MNKPIDQQRNYVASLTGLRGVAALFVFVFHYSNLNPGIRLDLMIPVLGDILQFPFGFGFTGVDMFFVLSGFLLSLPFAHASLAGSSQPPLAGYYKRRLLRVFPAYYAQLAIILIFGAWFVTWTAVNGISVMAHLLMFFNIGPDPIRPLVGIWWTLPVELSFYLILPLLAYLMRPGRWAVLFLTLAALSMLYRFWSVEHFSTAPAGTAFLAATHLPGSLPEFLWGATAAIIVKWLNFNTSFKPSARTLDALFLLGLLLAVLWLLKILLPNGSVYWAGHWSMIIAPVAFGLPLALMVISLYWGSRIGRVLFANPVIYGLGLISYSFYLWHFVVLQQLQAVLGTTWSDLHGLPRFLLSLAAVTAVSTLSYYAFERPFSRLGKRRKDETSP